MCRRPSRSAVQLARCIQHIIKRVLGLHLSLWPHIRSHLPTASCSPWIFFILDSGHLPTALLCIWQLILAHAIVLLVVAAVAVVLSSFLPTEALVPCVRLRSPL